MNKWLISAVIAFGSGLVLSFWWLTGPRDCGPLHTGGVWSVITFIVAMAACREHAEPINVSLVQTEHPEADRSAMFSALIAVAIFVPFLILHIGLKL